MKKLSATFAADNAANGSAPLAPDLRARLLGRMQGAIPSPHPAPLWRRNPGLVFGSGAVATLAMFAVFVPLFKNSAAGDAQMSKASNPSQVGIPFIQYGQDYDEAQYGPQASVGKASGAPEMAQPARSSKPELSANEASDLSETERAERPGKASRNLNNIAGDAKLALTGEMDGRQVHKEGSIGVVIAGGKLEATSDTVEEIARTAGGFVASNNLQTSASDGYKSADLTIKVPVQDFEDVMKRLAKLGEVVAKSVNGEDITEKTSDAVQAEQTLAGEVRATEARLRRERLSDRRATQKEVELRQVKIQLAQTRARLHLLRKLGALATITVSLTERPKTAAVAPPKSGFLADLGETNRAAAAAFQSAVRVPIVLVVWILAFSPIWGTLLLVYRWASVRSDRALTGGVTPHPTGAPSAPEA